MEDKYNLYDKIIATTFTNIANESPKDIYINFDKDSYPDKIFLQVSLLVAGFNHKKIYLKCKYRDYLKLLFHYYTKKQIILRKNRIRFSRRTRQWLDVQTLAAFEADAFGQDISIFEKIWKEYYQDDNN